MGQTHKYGKRIPNVFILFILQSVHLLYKYAIRIYFCFIRTRLNFIFKTTMYVYCVYPAMSKKSENLSDLSNKDRNKRHSSPFINVVKSVFFVVRVTLVPVSYLQCSIIYHLYKGGLCSV
jgi:hypothetical protein